MASGDALSRADVEEIAGLARLALEDHEIDGLRDDLTAILEAVAKLELIDTDGVPPMSHAVPMELRLRPDQVGPSLPAEVALAGAPDRDGDWFRVPHIIKSGTP